jgi:hypothetical protein
MPVPKPFRIAGQALPVVNQIFDTAAIVTALTDPKEPSRKQRLINTLAQFGNLGLGVVTGGLDVIPQIGAGVGVKGAAPFSPEAQLRRAAYLIGQGKDIGLDYEKQDAAVRALARGKTREPVYTPQQIEQMYGRGLGGMF